MWITTEREQNITPERLAKTLAESSPVDFAEFWFQFEKTVDDENLEAFAKAMSQKLGGARKRPLKKLCSLLEYYEMKTELEANA